MDVRIVTDVTEEPVSLAVLKDFCRIDPEYTGEDETLSLLQASARELLEGFLNISLAEKTIEVEFSGGHISLPYGPHGEVISVKDGNGDDIPPENYTITGLDFKSICTGIGGYSYFYPMGSAYPIVEPVGSLYDTRSIIKLKVGYTSENIQSGLKLLICRLVDYMYQNRGSEVVALPSDIRRDSKRYSRNSVL